MTNINYRAFKNDLKSLRKKYENLSEINEFELKDTTENRDYLISTTINLVEKRCYLRKDMCNNVINVEDLIQNGIMGVVYAVEKWFDKSLEKRTSFPNFKTFSYIWIEKYIKEYIDLNSSSVKHPIKKQKEALEEFKMVRSQSSEDSIYDYCTDTYDMEYVDEFMEDGSTKNTINELLLKSLGKKDSDILKAYFSFNGETRKDLSRKLGISMSNLNKHCKKLVEKVQTNNVGIDRDCLIDVL